MEGGPRGGAGRWGAPRRGRAGAEAAVSPAEAVLGEELSELLGAAEPRRAPRDEPEVSTGHSGEQRQGFQGGYLAGGTRAAGVECWRLYRPLAVQPCLSC